MPADLLFERELALEQLRQVVGAARSGAGAAALVTGVPGIGKTRLLASLVTEAAAAGVECVTAVGHALESGYGFGVVRQLFAQLPDHVVDLDGVPVAAPAGPDSDALFPTLQALVDAMTRSAKQRPLVVVVDDAQWVDEPSLRFLHFLSRRLRQSGVGLVVAARTGELAPSAVFAELTAALAEQEVALPPLTHDGVAAVLRARLGDVADEFVDACEKWTSGNPFYLAELMAAMTAEGMVPTVDGAAALSSLAPGTIGRLVLVRIARAGDAAVSLVQAVAVLGDAPSLVAAARLASLEVASAGAAAAALMGLDVLDADLRFAHPVVREAVYDDIAAPLRAARHLEAAQVLRQLGASIDAVAAQLLLAPPTGEQWATDVLQRAARTAVSQGAPEAAARMLRHAFGDEGADASSALLQEAEDRIDLDVTRTHLLWITGRSSEAIRLAERTAEDRSGDRTQEAEAAPDAMLAMKLMLQCVTPGSGRPSQELLERFAALSGATQVERDCLLPVILYRTSTGTPVEEVMPLVRRITEDAPPGSAERRSPATWLFLLLHLGEVERTLAFADRYLAAARRTDSVMWRSEALTVRALACYRLGRIAEAEADAREALVGVDASYAVTAPVAAATLMYALLELGDVTGASAVADTFAFPSHREDTAFASVAEAAIGRVRARAGDREGGLRMLLHAGERLDAVEWLITELAPWRIDAAQVLTTLGRRDEARAVVEPAYDVARRFGAPSGLGRALRVRALVEEPADLDLLREAVDVYAGGPMRLKLAHAQVDLGAALRRGGARTDARAHLAEGMDLARQCGAAPLQERAEAELQAAGARPRTAATTGVEALTAAEARVARLARNGLRNVDIARELFIQPTTVEKHLASVFRKLDIEGRAEIPDLG
ncbi:AAA family ATPase [Nocardioides humilatus]|uniref:AAA family ATPase n=1 Tax=Nocardioides humilatus TaxID=2607660 RepID=A0A5B1LMM3_9ACTN|nr:AAA family ATPase [Nocardioides humilatus]KAA1421726.1 AAA family ATPase [Nocardioides humilatus]